MPRTVLTGLHVPPRLSIECDSTFCCDLYQMLGVSLGFPNYTFWTVRGMDAALEPPWMGSRRVQNV